MIVEIGWLNKVQFNPVRGEILSAIKIDSADGVNVSGCPKMLAQSNYFLRSLEIVIDTRCRGNGNSGVDVQVSAYFDN